MSIREQRLLKSVDNRKATIKKWSCLIPRVYTLVDATILEDSEPFTNEDELKNKLVLEDFYHFFCICHRVSTSTSHEVCSHAT